mmetsp:Transcript_50117/g.89967  ORF Transcript_50117/g.89967 Transcript_50117/m.89967 type:complete len:105 (+) Transcript_50117:95-409(+)|eukprot:CAMPEP_0197674122 /NCGR_PEP_ID=MMETSP1338-20131121/82297_1 /TAXON_ID=43686 ORGANISM="Pelagodinium beii, Strain RCC1491" /NCGR_SAMPLE_ID=MMETSP1338 /ASSEMBLY_ACC=CAM_ASM_000754 /LENGTH=104 /DNA_ID=CAMNT_0043254461 /DNA_START=100 /DNA_END=414 /DNA_ORIENTATION=+
MQMDSGPPPEALRLGACGRWGNRMASLGHWIASLPYILHGGYGGMAARQHDPAFPFAVSKSRMCAQLQKGGRPAGALMPRFSVAELVAVASGFAHPEFQMPTVA